jgi:glycosyltransferase involved in cell wall biosynthesis
MTSPAISVVMAVYNGERFVQRAIDSVLKQTFPDFELIIVNDGSIDGTSDILAKASLEDGRIKVLENESNSGLIETRNKSIEYAKGKYIAVLDSDDECAPNRLEVQYNFMEMHPDVGLCGARFVKKFANGSEGMWDFPELDSAIRRRMFWGVGHLNSSVIMRRQVLMDHHIRYHPSFPVSEDFKLFFDIGKYAKMHNLRDVLGTYHFHDEQQTAVKKELIGICSAKIAHEHFELLGINLDQYNRELITKFYNFNFPFKGLELRDLSLLLSQFIHVNRSALIIPDLRIEQDIQNRFFEACYFSPQNGGLSVFNQSPFGEDFHISMLNRIKYLLRKLNLTVS